MRRIALIFLCSLSGLTADPRAGQFLVATRELADPNFAQSVVLLVGANDQGAFGLVINRPTTISANRALPQAPNTVLIFEGGPVEVFRVAALRRAPGVDQVLRGVSYLTEPRAIQRAIKDDLSSLRLYAGYAGWTAGQLDQEIAAGAWKLLPATADLVFDPVPETLWKRLIRRTETLTARLSGR